MYNINRTILKTTSFAVAALTVVMLVTSAIGTPIVVPTFAQGNNMTGGGNATEGNMTGTDMGGSGMATPSAMTP